jgi:RNA polymerase sigma-70 factor, ECF subfamily
MESSDRSSSELPAVKAGAARDSRESDAMQVVASAVGEVASEDARLVTAAQEGDRQAYARLFEKYRGPAYSIAYRLLGRREDALDTVQEAFTKAFSGLTTFRGGSSFKTWLFRIVTNCSLDLRRSRSVRQAVSLDNEQGPDPPNLRRDGQEPSVPAEQREMKMKIDAALGAIPESNRTAFVLFAVKGVSYRDIAEILNISIGTVMSRIFYARQKLQKILTGEEVGPAEGEPARRQSRVASKRKDRT